MRVLTPFVSNLVFWFGDFMGVDCDDDSKQIVQSDNLLDYAKSNICCCERLFGNKIIGLSA